ncbi:UDP-glucose--hexose-1-phosphate uridylyltransferase [Mollicutes bacterium LVI A0078]|nr:UDP-glucose--hexose-1-phosphate uridylyltransferase [Mollicutes bacterium LVI A0078]
MKTNINKLITYANERDLLNKRDNAYMYNQLCYLLKKEVTEAYQVTPCDIHIDDLLDQLASDYQQFETQTEKELFKSKIIGTVIERPSNIENRFYDFYNIDSKLATGFFYKFSSDVNYVKEREVAKNIEYKVDSEYGEIDITINLSKPEKSTKEIEMLKKAASSNWPLCFLCKEQEGLYGSLKNPDRSNHRIIGLELNNKEWFLQYSPFSYFNEHSIVLSNAHEDMKIDRNTFSNLIEFIKLFPHYMIGSNADIPIVGGSMLTHDHYQTGNYEFGLFKTKSTLEKIVDGVELHSVVWPLHTVKLVSNDTEKLLDMADTVLSKWLSYEDRDNNIVNFTTVKHNTITPIVRCVDGIFEMYLILRNNLTTEDHPTGLYHVDKSRHHIKQENIGLIEAMGLAVLPARLKTELETIASNDTLPADLIHHHSLFEALEVAKPADRKQYLYELVGSIFVECLEDCGVFKYDERKYIEFIRNINE